MEFSQKLQELRKQKGLTQEELAKELFVSRTAISKWELGRGYPNIESLKDIAKLFCVTIDDLLSSSQMLNLAEEDNKQKQKRLVSIIFGVLDLSVLLLLFIPFFAQRVNGEVMQVALLNLNFVKLYLKIIYFSIIISIFILGGAILSVQNILYAWNKIKIKISLGLNVIAVILFIITLQVYVAVFLFVYLIIKAFMLLNQH